MERLDLASLDFVFDQVEKAIDFQFQRLRAYDTRASMLLGFEGVIFTALLKKKKIF